VIAESLTNAALPTRVGPTGPLGLSGSGQMADETRLIHAVPTTMVRWILQALRDGPRKRSELLRHVDKLARLEGFRADNLATLKKALGSLERDGRVVKHQYGWWALATASAPKAKRPARSTEVKRPSAFVGSSTKGLAEAMQLNLDHQAGSAFIAMPITPDDDQLVDVLEAIKTAAADCGITAERVDEVESSQRITDRILESINKAEFVIVDLTNERPNVFFEAGFAHGLGKLPIYVARAGTTIHFDIKDYPIITFRNMKQLKEGITKRLIALTGERTQQ
jgi:hypothetical protein